MRAMEVGTKKFKRGEEYEAIWGFEPLNCQDVENGSKPAGDAAGCLGTGIFPEELWLHVLDKLSHSEDIINVLKAFPELDKSFQSKKAHWLFDQVLPHLMTKHLVIKKNISMDENHVDSRELLKLRLVSKRWKKAVEMGLETHADRHPIETGSKAGNQSVTVGLPMNHFNYERIGKYHLGATVFISSNQINDFLNEMRNFKGNPFPGKYVFFEIDPQSDEPSREFVLKSVELLQKFGEHVLILSWRIGDSSQCHLEVCKAILTGLSCAPNLQSLKFCGYLDKFFETADDYFGKQTAENLFPRLENLESFEWQVNMLFNRCRWVDRLINFYGGGTGLRKLALDYKYWNEEIAANLVNLTELHLLLENNNNYDIGEIRNVLALFPIGQLKKFCLSDYPEIKEVREMDINELIGIVEEFQIESVTFENINLKGKGSEIYEPVGGITSLYLDEGVGLSYEFLRKLPNLRFLNVHVPWERFEEFLRPECENEEDSLDFKLRQYFWNADKEYEWIGDGTFEIWKICEKLEMLSASVADGVYVFGVQYVREHGNRPFWGWARGEFGDMPEEKFEHLEEEMDRMAEEDE